MKLGDALNRIEGLRFMIDSLELRSVAARRSLLATELSSETTLLESNLEMITEVITMLSEKSIADVMQQIARELTQIKDISYSLKRLASGQNLDDVALFEIKAFSLASEKIRNCIHRGEIKVVAIPDLSNVVSLLDPELTGIAHFYIYELYDAQLAVVRSKLRKTTDAQEKEELLNLNSALEQKVRERISNELRACEVQLETALREITKLDILIAKARQAVQLSLSRPLITKENISYRGIFNPWVAHQLDPVRFQTADITIEQGPVLITGANMGGKTVLLKSIALSQALMQFGFFVPAQQALICPVEDIVLLGENSTTQGLSSFAYEMVRLEEMISAVRLDRSLLVLIDEPARTTNPEEGRAIVAAILDFLSENKVRSVVTTHLGAIPNNVKRLRVRGLSELAEDMKLDPSKIHELMDYSLEETELNDVPHEALRVARLLGTDTRLLEKASAYLSDEKIKNK